MNNYFKDRMDEIKHREEQMAERKKYETEIQSLEERLRGLETNYERLKTTNKSNLEMLALKRVDLVVAKEARAFAEDMLKKKEDLLVEEQQKLDDLHWKVWEEERRACDDLDKCLSDNDSVDFLNNFPSVLKTHKHSYNARPESENEMKKAVELHPEVKRLRAKVAALETEVNEAENSCLTEELKSILNRVEVLDRKREDEGKETQRLIEALERSHHERIALEAEIADIYSRKTDVPCGKPKLNTRQNISWSENESRRTLSVSLVPNEEKCVINKVEINDNDNNDVELELDIKQDKKLKAKKWYEEYTRSLDATDEENRPKKNCPTSDIFEKKIPVDPTTESCFFSSQSERLPPVEKTCLEDEDKGKCGDKLWERKLCQTISVKDSDKFVHPSQPVTSRFFVKTENDANYTESGFFTSSLKLKRDLESENEDLDAGFGTTETLRADRKFEPLTVTPSSFLNSVAGKDRSKRSTFVDTSSEAVQDIPKVKKRAKFTPKKPSNIANKSSYRQTKMDTFINFMISDDAKEERK